VDFRLHGEDAMPIFSAALDELEGNPSEIEKFRQKFSGLIKRPQEPQGGQPLCRGLFRKYGAYPGPGDGHVGEFFPQLMKPLIKDVSQFQGSAIRNVQKTYPILTEKMKSIASGKGEINVEDFARELAWEHTQFLDILVSQQDHLGNLFFVNLPNQGYIHNMPENAVLEIPATVDAAGLHPFAIGDLPLAVLPQILHKVASLDLIIEAAMEGSRHKAVQAYLNDPHCTNMHAGEKMVNELIDAELKYLPRFAA
jgi:alpha-galactosidase